MRFVFYLLPEFKIKRRAEYCLCILCTSQAGCQFSSCSTTELLGLLMLRYYRRVTPMRRVVSEI